MSGGKSGRPYALIRVEHREGVAAITLDNPTRRNAIGVRMVNELIYALEDAFADELVRSVVLTGAGDKAFCAGGDFIQMSGGADGTELPPKGDYADLLLVMVAAPKPIVARVNGHALGGGLGLVAACHFAVGVHGAKLGTPEVDVGLFPMMIMAVLRRLMPHRAMVQMMLLGEKLEANRAVELGLLGRSVEPSELDAAIREITDAIAAKSPIAIRLGLEALADQEDRSLADALPRLRDALAGCLATDDAREGLMAFLEKRKPVWTGR